MTTIQPTPEFEAAINLLSDLALKYAGAQALDAAIIVRATFERARAPQSAPSAARRDVAAPIPS